MVEEIRGPLWSGALSTADSLVFTGTWTDRDFTAFDAKTGDVVWKFRTNSGSVGVPVTYTVDGNRYVAVLSGFGGAIPLWAGSIHEQITKSNPVRWSGVGLRFKEVTRLQASFAQSGQVAAVLARRWLDKDERRNQSLNRHQKENANGMEKS